MKKITMVLRIMLLFSIPTKSQNLAFSFEKVAGGNSMYNVNRINATLSPGNFGAWVYYQNDIPTGQIFNGFLFSNKQMLYAGNPFPKEILTGVFKKVNFGKTFIESGIAIGTAQSLEVNIPLRMKEYFSIKNKNYSFYGTTEQGIGTKFYYLAHAKYNLSSLTPLTIGIRSETGFGTGLTIGLEFEKYFSIFMAPMQYDFQTKSISGNMGMTFKFKTTLKK